MGTRVSIFRCFFEFYGSVLAGLRFRIALVCLESYYFYKRNMDAIRRNSYNETILALQNLNMDAQFVLDSYSAATYIRSYMLKST
jgi:hypothetical protein